MRTIYGSIAASALFFLAALPCAAQQALLWIPYDPQGAGEIITALETGRELRLTAAFDELPKGLEERIKKLEMPALIRAPPSRAPTKKSGVFIC